MNFQRGSEQSPGPTTDIIPRYYLITVMLRDNSVHRGVREDAYGDLDSRYQLYKNKAGDAWGDENIIYFQCVQLSNHSDEVKDYKIKKANGKAVTRKITS